MSRMTSALEPEDLPLIHSRVPWIKASAYSPDGWFVSTERRRGPEEPGEQVDHLPEGPHGLLGPGGGRHRDLL